MIPLLGAFLVVALVIPLLGRLASGCGLVARIDANRWHRAASVPCVGGPALLAGIAPWTSPSEFLLLSGFCAVGLLDDAVHLRPLSKALLLIPPCLFAAWLSGEGWLAAACWVVSNAMNLLDHADGLAGASAAGSLLAGRSGLGLCGLGAVVGFLAHNLTPARAFLGDSGSLMLGALLVWTWAPQGPTAVGLGCAVPLLDAAYVVIRRLVAGRKPWIGGTDHTGHGLLRAGVPPRALAGVYGLLAFGAALLAGQVAR